MRETAPRLPDSSLPADIAALRRYFWLPLATIGLALVVAIAIGALSSGSNEARFREDVFVDALPPLFGPAIVPGPFDYAKLATSDAVVADVASQSGVAADQLKPRLVAEAHFNKPEIDFRVTGGNALAVARAWRDSFERAAVAQTGALQADLVQRYNVQLTAAVDNLRQRSDTAQASPDREAAQQQLKAAQENYQTAAKLVQSYEIVRTTMRAQPLAVVGPHTVSAGVGSTRGRIGAALAIGLLAGIIGAVILEWASRRGRPPGAIDAAPPPIRAVQRRSGRDAR